MSEQIQAEQTMNTSQEAGRREAGTGKAGPEASGTGVDNHLRLQKNGLETPDQEHGKITATAQFAFQGQAVRTILKDGETWFVAADVCAVLEHTDPSKAVSRLDDDERGATNVCTLGGNQQMNVVNESGLYDLFFTSRKSQAKAFRRWVTSEVLPSIRGTGRYNAGGTLRRVSPTMQGEVTSNCRPSGGLSSPRARTGRTSTKPASWVVSQSECRLLVGSGLSASGRRC